MGNTFISHNCLDICKVEVDKTWLVDQVCYTLNTLLKNLICLLECIRNTCSLITYLEELVIRDNDKCINVLLKSCNSLLGISHTWLALKTKWLCNYTNSKDSEISCHLCYNRSGTCTGSTTHTTCDKHHVGILDYINDFFSILLHCTGTNLRLCSGTKTLCKLLTYLDLCCCSAK